jgi:hypothetical protein
MDDISQPGRIPAAADPFQLKPYAGAVRPGNWARRLSIGGFFLFCIVYGGAFALLFPFLAIPLVIPLAVLAGTAVWALPDMTKAPVRLLDFLFFSFLVALVMWPNYLAIALPGLPWITVQRLIGLPLALVLLVCVSVSSSFRGQLSAALQATPLIWKLICTFVFIQVLSIVFSADKGDSVDKLITALTTWIAVFFCSTFVNTRNGRLEFFAGLICVMAVALGVMGIFEHRADRVLWAGHTPSFLQVNDENVERILAGTSRVEGQAHRVQATYSTSLGLGEYVALAMPFLFYFATGRYPAILRMAAIAAVPLLVLTVVFTQARVGFVGILISVLVYPFTWLFLLWRRNPKSLLAASAMFFSPVLLGAALVTTYVVPGIRVRMWGGGREQLSTQARVDQFHMGVPKLMSHPWGYGIGQGATALGYANPAGVLTIDSYSLRLAMEYGIVGLIVFYAVFVAALYYASRGALAAPQDNREAKLFVPIGIALLSFIVIKSVFAQEDNQSLVFMLLGMLAALAYRVFGAQSGMNTTRSRVL